MALGSFSAGLSGLNANGTFLSVIGNNLANINTVGFKASTVTFQDLVNQSSGSVSANPMQVGLGVVTGAISPVFSQGTVENTRDATNAAIQGNGFFIVRNPEGLNTYTRAGDFSFDRDGRLVTPDFHSVLGFTDVDPLTGQIVATGQPAPIVIPPGVLRAPVATSQFTTGTNLDAQTPAGSTFSAAVQVYDSLGAPHVATITYTRQATAGTWAYAVTVRGEEVVGGTAGTPTTVGTGTLVFDATGTLSSVNGGAPADVTIATPAWANGAAASAWQWNIMDDDGTPTLTGYAVESATAATRQNGAAAGTMTSLIIEPDGMITATFGAGQAVAIGQLALATFNNPKGLVKLGSSKYGETAVAGIPSIGAPGTGGRGTLIGSAVEQSNVDIAQEFTQMILAQRGYQANSKSITVADELLIDTLNIKR